MAIAITPSASTTHCGSIETPRHSITPKMSARYTMLPMSSAPGRRTTARTSRGAGNRHRCDLHGRREGQRIGAERRARVLAGLPEDFDQKLGRAVDDFGLIPEAIRGEHEAHQLR